MEWMYRMRDADMTPTERDELARVEDALDAGTTFEHLNERLEHIGEGCTSIVYGTESFAVKVAGWLDEDFLLEEPSEKRLADGAFMRRFEGKIPMPRLYAYSDGVVVMERIRARTFTEAFEELSVEDAYRELGRLTGDLLKEHRLSFLDLHGGNLFVGDFGRPERYLLIDFDHVLEWGEHDGRREMLLENLEEFGTYKFYHRYTGTTSAVTKKIERDYAQYLLMREGENQKGEDKDGEPGDVTDLDEVGAGVGGRGIPLARRA